jgi:hypothetical protein
MKFASLVIAFLAFAALPRTSHAGGYVSAGVGTAPATGGELSFLDASSSQSARVGLGHGFGPVSLEASLGGYGVRGGTPDGGYVDGTALAAGVSVRGNLPLFAMLSAFGRVGLERSWVAGEMGDLSGEGYLLGAGLELGLPMLLGDSSVFLEIDREYLTLQRSMGSYDGFVDTATLGLRVGL